MRFLLILLLCTCSCKQQDKEVKKTDINSWYEAIYRARYANNDSLKFLIEELEKKTKGKPAEYQAIYGISKGLYYTRKGMFKESLHFYQEAYESAKRSGIDSVIAKTYSGIGVANTNLSKYPEAVEYLQKALVLYEKNGIRQSMAGSHSALAQVYQLKEDLPEAKNHLQQALNILKDKKQSTAYLNTAHTLANVYGMSNQLDSALALDEEGLAIAESMNSNLLKSIFYDNKANCFMYSNRFDSARFYFNKCLGIDSVSGNMKQVADTYLNLGVLEGMQQNDSEAEKNFLKSVALARMASNREGEKAAWSYITTLYKKRGDLNKALEAQRNYINVKDSIINEKTEEKLAELETIYEADKKEQQIVLQAAQISRQKIITIAIITVAFALLFSGYAFYRRYQVKKARQLDAELFKQKQQATIQILSAEEKERQRIASDLHDGIGQMMTAAWLNLQALGKRLNSITAEQEELITKTAGLVGDSCAEIRQVSHTMMPGSVSKKGLINTIKEFINKLDSDVLSIRLNAEDELQLEKTDEVILYRVIQECINNVVRHAEADELDISITSDREGADILIEDNGKGFDTSRIRESDGIGIQNILSRIQYLNGTVEWDNTGNGTVVAIHIPYKNDR